ncbi:MAG: isocitrate dehydrogenase [Candidatus Bipolaricaulota bacterium]|nr:isocitrate dehydrogenase [Candidatus Bipolaricaulota bacterium]MDW8031478.1 isocitrate dehydrogenase [Candidatus Bipolaricaulota bacterium]
MKLVGADVYIWSQGIPEVPKQVGPFQLLFISNRGTRVLQPVEPKAECIDWWRCRYRAEREVSHHEVHVLLETLSQKHVWTQAQKLFEISGTNAYSEPY